MPKQLILLPARVFEASKAQKLVWLLQREPLRAVGRAFPLKGNQWTLPTGSLEFIRRGGEYGTGLLAVTLHLLILPPSPLSPSLLYVLHSCFLSGLWQDGQGIEPRCQPGEEVHRPNPNVASLIHSRKFITLFCTQACASKITLAFLHQAGT